MRLALVLAACQPAPQAPVDVPTWQPATVDEVVDLHGPTDPFPPGEVGSFTLDTRIIHEVALTVDPAWLDEFAALVPLFSDSFFLVNHPDATMPFRPGTVAFDGSAPARVGVRPKGGTGTLAGDATGAQAWKLDIDRYAPEQTADGLTTLYLQPLGFGETGYEEHVVYAAFRDAGLPAPRTAFARVSLNGEDQGIYTLVEGPDRSFLERAYGNTFRGDLYKPQLPSGTLEWRGDDIDDYPQIGHEDDHETDHGALVAMLMSLNLLGGNDLLADVLDLDGVFTYLAGNVLAGNEDDYHEGHNYLLYEVEPGRFTLLPWDVNSANQGGFHPCGPGRNPQPDLGYLTLTDKTLGDPDLFARYALIFEQLHAGPFAADALAARYAEAEALVGRLGDDALADLLDRLRLRHARLAEQLGPLVTCPERVEPEGDCEGQGHGGQEDEDEDEDEDGDCGGDHEDDDHPGGGPPEGTPPNP